MNYLTQHPNSILNPDVVHEWAAEDAKRSADRFRGQCEDRARQQREEAARQSAMSQFLLSLRRFADSHVDGVNYDDSAWDDFSGFFNME